MTDKEVIRNFLTQALAMLDADEEATAASAWRTKDQAAAERHLSPRFVADAWRRGELRGYGSRKTLRFRTEDLEAWDRARMAARAPRPRQPSTGTLREDVERALGLGVKP